MPPLVRGVAGAVRYSPEDLARLRLYGHTQIDSRIEPDGGSAAMVLGILCLMRNNLLGDGSWGLRIRDHDLVPKVPAPATPPTT